MAGPGFLLDLEKQHILVAINEPANDALGVPAGLAFEPQLSPGSTPIGHQTTLQSQGERLAVHPGEHQNPPGGPFGSGGLLNDHRNQTLIGKFKIEVHSIASLVVLDNLAGLLRQHKEMPESANNNPPSSLRHLHRPMEKIRLRFSDFASAVPPEHLLGELPNGETIELDAHAALSHIVPQISIRVLAKERPDLFLPSDHSVKLPPHRIAAAYRMLEESYDPKTEPKLPAMASGNFNEATKNLHRLSKIPIPAAIEPVTIEPAAIEPATIEPATIEPATIEPADPIPLTSHEPQGATDQPHRLIELIHSLPTFHRFTPAPPVSTLIEPLVLETENPGTDIPEQDSLQALFLTDEKLTIRRVVELCGDLPGIRSCVLTRDDTVVASHTVPENFDLVAMSSTASKMLAAMQESSSQLGIGAVPALTLHTERGPLSLVQINRLTLLVVHSDRGFIPGVREKLTAALGELSRAPLALPSAAAPAGGMPLPPAEEQP